MKRSFSTLRWLVLTSALGCWPAGCQTTSVSDDGVTDSHTNWLVQCESDAACGDLECLCGVCTRSCQSDFECSDLADEARCSAWFGEACSVPLVCNAQGDAAVATPLPTQTDPDEGDCAGVAPSCPAACLAAVPAECDAGVWTCPSSMNFPCSTDVDLGDASTPSVPTTVADPESAPTDAGSGAIDGGGAVGKGVDAADGGVVPADAGNSDNCATAMDGAACAVEGQVCGGPCLDACAFCNLMSCTGGTWRRLEVFPAPCYACGDLLTCDATTSYCQLELGNASCEALPTPCASEPSCACLEAEIANSACSGEAEGQLMVEVSIPSDFATRCSCSVFTSESNWCGEGGFGDADHPVEWVCDTTDTNLLAELGVECIELATGAPRWCCAQSFAPACE